MGAEWETSAVYLGGLVKAARDAGLLERVLPRVSDEVRAAVADPHSRRWHPSRVTVGLSEAILEEAGAQALEELSFVVAKESFGPIVGSMAKVTLTLFGVSPATLFQRFDQSIQAAAKDVRASWRETGPRSGALSMRYPGSPPRPVETTLRGAIHFAFHLVGTRGTISPAVREPDGVSVRFDLSW